MQCLTLEQALTEPKSLSIAEMSGEIPFAILCKIK